MFILLPIVVAIAALGDGLTGAGLSLGLGEGVANLLSMLIKFSNTQYALRVQRR